MAERVVLGIHDRNVRLALRVRRPRHRGAQRLAPENVVNNGRGGLAVDGGNPFGLPVARAGRPRAPGPENLRLRIVGPDLFLYPPEGIVFPVRVVVVRVRLGLDRAELVVRLEIRYMTLRVGQPIHELSPRIPSRVRGPRGDIGPVGATPAGHRERIQVAVHIVRVRGRELPLGTVGLDNLLRHQPLVGIVFVIRLPPLARRYSRRARAVGAPAMPGKILRDRLPRDPPQHPGRGVLIAVRVIRVRNERVGPVRPGDLQRVQISERRVHYRLFRTEALDMYKQVTSA